MSYDSKLKDIVNSSPLLMEVLGAAREMDLPDWCIAAGAIRNTVWNSFHNYPLDHEINDIDVLFYYSDEDDGLLEKNASYCLNAFFPAYEWDVVNQAKAQVMGLNPSRPIAASTKDSLAYFSETSTSVGVRLEKDNSLTIISPHGLNDLLNLVVAPVPGKYQDAELYEQRVSKKRWKDKWPKLRVDY